MHWIACQVCVLRSKQVLARLKCLQILKGQEIRMVSTSFIKDKAYVNNEWVAAKSGKTFNVYNPSSNEVVGTVPDMNAADTEGAVIAAYTAFKTWKKTTARSRGEALKRLYGLLKDNSEELAKLITLEMGKPLAEARGEIAFGSSFCEWFAEEGRRVQGTIVNSPFPNKNIMTLKQPIGVCGMITPWNFPVAMVTRKACAAIAAGCTVVIKPSEDTPLSALAMCELFEKAGFPAGVFNVVTCDRGNTAEVGKVLCESKLVSLISFTGSCAVGKILLRQSAGTVKKCAMELGGNAPFIVFDSADVDSAVAGAIASKFRNTGQTCVCANRFLVQEGIYEKFVARLGEAIDQQLKVGDGLAPGTTQGPLINSRAVDKVESFVQDAVSRGAEVVTGGQRSRLGANFYEPTLLKGVSTNMMCVKDEIFGPVAAVMKFKTEEEALKIAHGTSAGLAGYVYTGDASQMFRVAEELEFGIVGVNEGLVQTPEAPWGGYKESGLGREGGIGHGIDEFLEVKYVCMGI